MKLLLIILLLSSYSYSYEKNIRIKSYADLRYKKLVKDKVKTTSSSRKKGPSYSKLSRLKKENDELKKQLAFRSQLPYVSDETSLIVKGDTYEGTLLNTINSSNIDSPAKIALDFSDEFGSNAYLECNSAASPKRAIVLCKSLIIDRKEYRVNVEILDSDGTKGLRGIIEDGIERQARIKIGTSIIEKLILGGIDKINNANRNNVSTGNILVGGGLTGASALNDAAKSAGDNIQTYIYVEAGKRVIARFRTPEFKEARYE